MFRKFILLFAITCSCLITTGYFMSKFQQRKPMQHIQTARSRDTLEKVYEDSFNFKGSFPNFEVLVDLDKGEDDVSVPPQSVSMLKAFTYNVGDENKKYKVVPIRPKIQYLISVDGVRMQCEDTDVCLDLKEVNWKMFTFVKSQAANIQKRKFIRQTWGSFKYVSGIQFSTIFVIGSGSIEPSIQGLIEEEAARFNDILQINASDDYPHVGLKTLAGMQWAAENLEDKDFYSSCDDDMLVNLGGIQDHIDRYIEENSTKHWPEFPIICSYEIRNRIETPNRDVHNKNYVSEIQFKWPQWPGFCAGGMYTTSVSVARQLFEISRTQSPLLNVDDVWITGILRTFLGLPESMLIKPEEALASHLGFLRSKKPSYLLFLWKEILLKFKSKPFCKC